MHHYNKKDLLKGKCCLCKEKAVAWINNKKYCRRCQYLMGVKRKAEENKEKKDNETR